MNKWLDRGLTMAGAITAFAAAMGVLGVVLGHTDFRPVLISEFRLAEDGTAASILKLQQAADANAALLLSIEWQTLDIKLRKGGGLDFAELQRYCSLSRSLQYVHIPECGL